MLLQVAQVILLLVVFLSVRFGDAVMYDGALIWVKYVNDLDAVDTKFAFDKPSHKICGRTLNGLFDQIDDLSITCL